MKELKSILILTILSVMALTLAGCSNCDSEDTLCFADIYSKNKGSNTNTTGGGGGGGLKAVPIAMCQPIFSAPYISTASGERMNITGTNPASSFVGCYPSIQLISSQGTIQVFEGAATFMLKSNFFENFLNTTPAFCLTGNVTAQRPPSADDKFHIGVNNFSSEINSSQVIAYVYWDGIKFHFSLDDSYITDGQNRDLVTVIISVNLAN